MTEQSGSFVKCVVASTGTLKRYMDIYAVRILKNSRKTQEMFNMHQPASMAVPVLVVISAVM